MAQLHLINALQGFKLVFL